MVILTSIVLVLASLVAAPFVVNQWITVTERNHAYKRELKAEADQKLQADAKQKLTAGTRVADSGCGYGASTLIMAKAFPKSEFYGFDLHPASIETANGRTKEQQITNVHFSIATAKDFPGRDYGFVTVFDALHDMGDPVGAASHVKQSLQPDGTFMIVEPMAEIGSLRISIRSAGCITDSRRRYALQVRSVRKLASPLERRPVSGA